MNDMINHFMHPGLQRLSRNTVTSIHPQATLSLPAKAVFRLPEKVLQFGTGVFIRGLIDYYIDKANNQGIFNGRVVMVKSTAAGDIGVFRQQDCLYTLLMKSVDEGVETDKKVICAGISRVLDAMQDWQQVLDCAADPGIQIILSNTTEAGITFLEDDRVDAGPPLSFPGKLLAVLIRRFQACQGSLEGGFVIVPTELIPDNGQKLKSIVLQLAKIHHPDEAFMDWLQTANDFCNSLVDRIVPGKPAAAVQERMEKALGYRDDAMIMSESFGLWAIETHSPQSRNRLSFSQADPGIHIVENIEKFRELKLRLLNASHNLSCALGYLAGFDTVKEAMAHPGFDAFMRRLILDEIASAILSSSITIADTFNFGTKVLDRYRNPYIGFEWLSICVQDTSKMKIRAVPVIRQVHAKTRTVPDGISLGFAAYIRFMRSEQDKDGTFRGHFKGRDYIISDDSAHALHAHWKNASDLSLVQNILADRELWETDLSTLQGFAESVTFYLDNLDRKDVLQVIKMASAERNLPPPIGVHS